MQIEKISIDDIVPYEYNAKLHPQEQIEQIKKSILEFGNNDPIAIDEDNMIIEGHGRYIALKQLGYKEIEIIKLTHLSDEQKKAYILVHNQLTMNSDFDKDLLSSELFELQTINFDIDGYGFDLDLDEELEEEDEFEDKPEVLKYNLIFGCEEEQETFLRFVEYLKEKYPDLDTITSRLYAYINEYI